MTRDDDFGQIQLGGQELDVVRNALARRVEREPEISAAQAFRGVRGLIAESDYMPASNTNRSRASRWVVGMTSAAAACAIIAVGYPKVSEMLTARSDKVNVREYITKSRQRATVTLPGGIASVVLAPNTKLSVTGNEVELSGEAVFTVQHNRKAPFTVKTANSVTRVLGTTFAVRQYSDDISTRVVVAEGKVSVNNSVLAIGDVATVAQSASPSITHEANIAALLSWTAGKLVFNRSPLEDVAKQLSRWYGLNVQVADATIQDMPLTATVDLSASAMNEIQAIAVTLGLSVEQKGQTVTFLSEHK